MGLIVKSDCAIESLASRQIEAIKGQYKLEGNRKSRDNDKVNCYYEFTRTSQVGMIK
jgi:hypothetical protein